jgi:hypothetical protein
MGSLALWLKDWALEASPVGLLSPTLDWLLVERAIYKASSFHLARSARLSLAHRTSALAAFSPWAFFIVADFGLRMRQRGPPSFRCPAGSRAAKQKLAQKSRIANEKLTNRLGAGSCNAES